VIFDHSRPDEAGELEAAVAVRRAHHGNFDMLIAQTGDTSTPFAFDRGPAFKLEAKLDQELNRGVEVLDDDSDIVHPLERHVSISPCCRSNLQAVAWSDNARLKGRLHKQKRRLAAPFSQSRPWAFPPAWAFA
jgi:hypothetical protein